MIGIAVITHGPFGRELLDAAKQIMKCGDPCLAINLTGRRDLVILRGEVQAALETLHAPKGILLLIDAMGGSPYNTVLPLIAPGRLEVVTGVNLPMLLSAFTNRMKLGLTDLARKVAEDARKTTVVASPPRTGRAPGRP